VVEKPRRRVGHGGSVRGFHCQFSRFPDDDACIVVLCNGLVVPPFVVEGILQALVFGGSPQFQMPPATVAWPSERIDALVGVYEAADRERIVVRAAHGMITLGAQGPGITAELAIASCGSAPPPVDRKMTELAREMVLKLASGDVGLIRERMAARIPASWPDRLLTGIWPERVSGLGAFSGARIIGSASSDSSGKVFVAADFAQGSVHVEVGFGGDRLERFDVRGPEFLVEAVAAPAPDGRLARYHWQGPPAEPIAVVRDAAGAPTALRFDRSGTTFRRLVR
jgi:hypothetical protein